MMTRYIFGRDVLFGELDLVADDLLCLQQNPRDRYFDVTFYTVQKYEEVRGRATQLLDTVLKSFQMVNLGRSNQRVITVQLYNPWVTEDATRRFLSRFVTVLPGVRDVRDLLGLWTGKRQYRVLLADDPVGYDGYRHPPATFTIGADRGYLSYAGQPMYCRKCSTYGHIADDCLQRRCRNCDELGHIMAECRKAKRCSLCGSEAHLYRQCTEVGPTYAAAVQNNTVEAPAMGQGAQQQEDISDDTMRDLEMAVAEVQRAREEREEGERAVVSPVPVEDPGEGASTENWGQQVEGAEADSEGISSPEWAKVGGKRGRGRKRKMLKTGLTVPYPSPLETGNAFDVLFSGSSGEEEVEEEGESDAEKRDATDAEKMTVESVSGSVAVEGGSEPHTIQEPPAQTVSTDFPTLRLSLR